MSLQCIGKGLELLLATGTTLCNPVGRSPPGADGKGLLSPDLPVSDLDPSSEDEFDSTTCKDSKAPFDLTPGPPSVGLATERKRQRINPEEATHECRICGKLFKRSYNWKSHLETHNPNRRYPYSCTAVVHSQLCTKRFQRKTDLDRHNETVS